MRILALTPFYPHAGSSSAGCFVAEPLRVLREFGIRSSVIAAQSFYHHARINQKAEPATWVRYPSLPSGLGLASAGAFLYSSILAGVRKLHQQERVNLIHAHAALPCGHAAALLSHELGIPFVVTVHGLDAFFTRQVRGFAGQWCKRVAQFVYRSAAQVVCVSEKVAQQLTSANPKRVCVIYNGVDPEIFAPSPPDNKPDIILSVGNLIPSKGHEILLRAFSEVRHRYPATSCEIIGEGPERSRLSALASQLNIADRVRFLGRQDRNAVADALRRCVVFALPSMYEGLGCVYLEAMATGKPTIACQGQGIAEIIRHKSNGWLTDPDNVRQLAESFSILLGDRPLQQKIGERARETVLQGFTLRHQAAQLAQLYQECAA